MARSAPVPNTQAVDLAAARNRRRRTIRYANIVLALLVLGSGAAIISQSFHFVLFFSIMLAPSIIVEVHFSQFRSNHSEIEDKELEDFVAITETYPQLRPLIQCIHQQNRRPIKKEYKQVKRFESERKRYAENVKADGRWKEALDKVQAS